MLRIAAVGDLHVGRVAAGSRRLHLASPRGVAVRDIALPVVRHAYNFV